MELFVRGLNVGDDFIMNVTEDTTIGECKQKIHDKRGYNINEMRLIIVGKQPHDSLTLKDLGIKNLATMHVLARLLGD